MKPWCLDADLAGDNLSPCRSHADDPSRPCCQVRLVWEALLFMHSAGTPATRSALESSIRARIDLENFGPCSAHTMNKKVHETPMGCTTKGQASFVMMKTKAAEAEAGPSGDGMAASGRHSVVMVKAEEKEERIRELLDERMGEIETLSRLMRRKKAATPGKSEAAAEDGTKANGRKLPVFVEAVAEDV